MATFVIAHGAWSSGWAWRKIRPLLWARGHEVLTPSYTGLGERAHLATPSIDLDAHVQDLLQVLEYENLTGVTLVGHSFGGIVAASVAGRAADRVDRLVYLDAFIPEPGRSFFDIAPANLRVNMEDGARVHGGGWRVPPIPLPSDTPDGDAAWAAPRRTPHPIGAFRQPVRLARMPACPSTYIYCRRAGAGDVFRTFADRARRDGWPCLEIDASHNPHITAPAALCDLLERVVGGPAPQSLE